MNEKKQTKRKGRPFPDYSLNLQGKQTPDFIILGILKSYRAKKEFQNWGGCPVLSPYLFCLCSCRDRPCPDLPRLVCGFWQILACNCSCFVCGFVADSCLRLFLPCLRFVEKSLLATVPALFAISG